MSTANRPRETGLGALVELRRALLRAAVVAGSLAVVTVLAIGGVGGERRIQIAGEPLGLDEMMTGSIGGTDRYVSSRSVLQTPGSAPCLYFPDGTRRGSC